MMDRPRFPGIRVTTNGNQLVAYHREARLTDGGVFFPITPSTEMGETTLEHRGQFECAGKNWGSDFDYVTGGGARYR